MLLILHIQLVIIDKYALVNLQLTIKYNIGYVITTMEWCTVGLYVVRSDCILKMIAKDAIEPDCNLKIALSNHMSLKKYCIIFYLAYF